VALIERVQEANPFTTLQVVLELAEGAGAEAVRRSLGPRTLEALLAACQSRPTYLDRYYALQPGRPRGAKRLVLLLPPGLCPLVGKAWFDEAGALATCVPGREPSA
jgi:hypothetical protein